MRMLSTRTESSRVLRFVLDQLLLAGAFAAAYGLKLVMDIGGTASGPAPTPHEAATLYLFAAPLIAIGLWACGLYRMGLEPLWPRLGGLRELLWGALVAMSVLAVVSLVAPQLSRLAGRPEARSELPRAVPYLFLLTGGAALALSRLLVEQVSRQLGAGRQRDGSRLVAFGMSRRVLKLLAALQRSAQADLQILGIAAAEAPPDLAPRLSEAEAMALLQQGAVDHVLVEAESVGRDRLEEILALSDREGISVHITSALFPSTNLMPSWERVDGVPLLGFVSAELPLGARMVKRVFDVSVSGVLLALLAVPMAVVAVLIRLGSPGPAFYVQERVGMRGRIFRIFKFRTMRVDAEAESGPTFARTDDPRCTPLGLYMRRHYLDELPQLVNVFLGHMSLVGPRPERPEFVRDFKQRIERYAHKHWVKPGITGWAQVNGLRGMDTDLQERVDHDLYYIENWSLMLDLRILIRTAFDAYLRAA
ncbi:MAG: exopolysaccharide biosynthesis polyprenyl glycosylphosphotransferase [Planctomycetota bacterium]